MNVAANQKSKKNEKAKKKEAEIQNEKRHTTVFSENTRCCLIM